MFTYLQIWGNSASFQAAFSSTLPIFAAHQILMELQQINITYQHREDRLLIRLAFAEAGMPEQTSEIGVHFTRRMTMMFWPKLIEAMNRQLILSQPQAAHASSEMVAMEHEAAVQEAQQRGGFSSDYELDHKTVNHPLGEAPLIPDQIDLTPRKDQVIELNFIFNQNPGFKIKLAKSVLHGFCKLMQSAVEHADWGFILEIPGATPGDNEAAFLN